VLDGGPAPQKGHGPSIFSPCLLMSNGRPSQLLLSSCFLVVVSCGRFVAFKHMLKFPMSLSNTKLCQPPIEFRTDTDRTLEICTYLSKPQSCHIRLRIRPPITSPHPDGNRKPQRLSMRGVGPTSGDQSRTAGGGERQISGGKWLPNSDAAWRLRLSPHKSSLCSSRRRFAALRTGKELSEKDDSTEKFD